MYFIRSLNKFFHSVNALICPIHREGYLYIFLGFVLSFVLGFFSTSFFILGLLVTLWICYFFRDPIRHTIIDPNYIVSPADGTVCSVCVTYPPAKLNIEHKEYLKISIFMNVFDCHINRSPVDGYLQETQYVKGQFLNADDEKSSENNEQQLYHITTSDAQMPQSIYVVQVAGLVARRIIPFVKVPCRLLAGERIGMIRFGSRVDVYLSVEAVPMVALNQKVVAGETLIASFGLSKSFKFRQD